jgi:hypothetical protein
LRKWVYAVVGVVFVFYAALAWFEQSVGMVLAGGSQALAPSYGVLVAMLVSLIVGPLALYDVGRWMRTRGLSTSGKVMAISVVVLSFMTGFLLKWNGALCLEEVEGVHTCWSPEQPVTALAVGLLFVSFGALAVWVAMRNTAGGKMSFETSSQT